MDNTATDITTQNSLQNTPQPCTCGKNEGGPCLCATNPACASCKNTQRFGTRKLDVYNWLYNLPEAREYTQMVEVQFKNTRKGYYLNSNNLDLNKGDIVAVEATPGHDIGEVSLTGKLVLLQMKKNNYRTPAAEVKRIYRVARTVDMEKYHAAKQLEHKTMLRAREIAESRNLHMKISDVEYQGDGNKAIFYYIADERVDFRQLIKEYAQEFKVKIEMKQIGARQEAGRVGGIGACGRELCCSSSIASFVSVSTAAARFQDISLNPQKLAGQCGKLKCCLNFEIDAYVEAQRALPPRDTVLETADSQYFHFKTDIFSGQITYSTDKHIAANLVTIGKDRVFEIIEMNKEGKKPASLQWNNRAETAEKIVAHDVLENESITRFDKQRRKRKRNRNTPQNQQHKPDQHNRRNRK